MRGVDWKRRLRQPATYARPMHGPRRCSSALPSTSILPYARERERGNVGHLNARPSARQGRSAPAKATPRQCRPGARRASPRPAALPRPRMAAGRPRSRLLISDGSVALSGSKTSACSGASVATCIAPAMRRPSRRRSLHPLFGLQFRVGSVTWTDRGSGWGPAQTAPEEREANGDRRRGDRPRFDGTGHGGLARPRRLPDLGRRCGRSTGRTGAPGGRTARASVPSRRRARCCGRRRAQRCPDRGRALR